MTFYCTKCGRVDDDLGQCGGPPSLPCPEPTLVNPNAVVVLYCASHQIARAFTALDIIRGKVDRSAVCGPTCVVAVITEDPKSEKVPAPLGDALPDLGALTTLPEGLLAVPTVEYEDLRDDARFLAALEAAGVDNWEGYSIAYREAHPEQTALLTEQAGGPAQEPQPEPAPEETAPAKAGKKGAKAPAPPADPTPAPVVEDESN